MTDNQKNVQVHAFAVPALLMRSLGLKIPSGANMTRMSAETDGFNIAVDLFSFRSARARNKAASAFVATAKQTGKTLEKVACLADNTATDLYVTVTSAELSSPDEQNDRNFYLSFKEFIDPDFEHLKAVSRFFGLPIVLCHGHDIIQPPFPQTKDGRIYFFYCSRPPGAKPEIDMPVEELFGLKLWKHGEKRFIHPQTPGRGRVIEQNGVCVFQVLGRNYYQICLVPFDEHHPVNRDTIFVKLLEVLYHDLLEHNGTDLEVAEATSEELVTFGEKQADKLLRDERDDLKKTEYAISKKEQELFELLAKRDQSMRVIRAISADPFTSELHDRLPKECSEIKNVPHVSSVHIVDEAIQIKTTPIVITHENVNYDLGPFIIRLDNKGKPPVWSDNPKHPKGHHHPHLGRIQLACFGNITLAVAKHIAAFRYADATRLVIRWLHSYNPDNTLTLIEEWAPEKNLEVPHD